MNNAVNVKKFWHSSKQLDHLIIILIINIIILTV